MIDGFIEPSGRKFLLKYDKQEPATLKTPELQRSDDIVDDEDPLNKQLDQKSNHAVNKKRKNEETASSLSTLQRNVQALDLRYGKIPLVPKNDPDRQVENLDSLSQDSYGTSDYDKISKVSVVTAPLHQNKKNRT
jgi:hypothetical protein